MTNAYASLTGWFDDQGLNLQFKSLGWESVYLPRTGFVRLYRWRIIARKAGAVVCEAMMALKSDGDDAKLSEAPAYLEAMRQQICAGAA